MTETHWRKSSYSGQEGDCVEVADTLTALRDSKNANSPVLGFNLEQGLAFIRAVRTGRFDR